MPLGEVLAELIGAAVGQFLWDGLVVRVIWPVVHFPGTVLGWSLWRGRPFRRIWREGDHFQQTMAGLFIWTGLVVILVAG
ncbi:MAG TPA: hypothetical protein PKJ19_04375 [Flavobacteriales bacterium]|nr:hypothetical protein [Flavobacteriales bacterium]HNU56223.1 hypothetical protein [Flavobacteriales bacterium]